VKVTIEIDPEMEIRILKKVNLLQAEKISAYIICRCIGLEKEGLLEILSTINLPRQKGKAYLLWRGCVICFNPV